MSYASIIDETLDEGSLNEWEKSKYRKVTRSSGYHSTGYDLSFLKTGSSKIRAEQPYFLIKEGKIGTDAERIGKKEAIGRLQRQVIDLSQQLEKTEDLFEQGNIGLEIKRILKDLWQLRNVRESNWGDLINIQQAIFANIHSSVNRTSH